MSFHRPCLGGCGDLIPSGSYCKDCLRLVERRRGSTTERFGSGWKQISRKVIARDKGICHICGLPGADTADHLIPRSKGGTNHPSNLAAAHRACNSRKGIGGGGKVAR